MAWKYSDLPQLPADVCVQLAEVCDEVEVESSKSSSQPVRAKICCFCWRSIKLGAGSSDYSLQQHMVSYKCREFQKQLADTGFDFSSLLSRQKTLDIDEKPRTQGLDKCIPSSAVPATSVEGLEQRPERHLLPNNAEVCPGALFYYRTSMFSHYPWHLHDSDLLDYQLSFIDPKGRFIRVCSYKCTQKSPGKGGACSPCSQIIMGQQFQDLVKRADPNASIAPSTHIQLRTYSQLRDLVKDKTSKINELKLKDVSSQRCIQSLLARTDEQKRLMLAISQSDDMAVGRIVKTALRNGAGIETIIDRIVRAQQGLYSPKNYSQKAFDLVALVLRIGGPRLAFAVAKALHLPSVSTVRERLNLPRLLPSVGFPTSDEILANIETFFGSESLSSSSSSRTGWSLMIDELAKEARLRYHKLLDAIIGVCREHADADCLRNLSSRSDTLETLKAIKKQLDTGGCHRATEATMAALARFGSSDYNPTVVLASGTCKTEKAEDQARWIELILNSWRDSPSGEVKHGPIWSVCTDGDAKRRRAIFPLCMTSLLPESCDLYRLIGHLPLLNLYCGPTQITHDGDYKHEEKRLASALRSRSGILINGAHITPKMLVRYLRSLDELSESRILSLFNGTDPQNVPKANTLLMSIYKASQLPAVASHAHNKPFVLLGEVLGSFVRPFTVPAMTLDEQITSLSKCAHLIFALYRIDGTKFLSGQLFYDIQASIKNVIFCVAKTQLIGSDTPFYLLQTGTDRLEARFGTYRTATSDTNGDLMQMCDRAAGTQHIDEIFLVHPDWNRAPYRLSLDGKSGIDHTNPSSWTGDVVVGNVNLHDSWLRGRSQAAAALTQGGAPFAFDQAILQTESPSIDLMRPSGSYPGIQVDTIEPNLQPVAISELVDEPPTADSYSGSDLNSDLAGDTNNSSDNTSLNSSHSVDFDLELDQPLPEMTKEASLGHHEIGWVLVEDSWVPLESAVRYLLGNDGGAKSTDRLRRVRGFTRYMQSETKSNSILGDYFHVSDLVATLLRTKDQVVLAVARITSITGADGTALEAISDQEFQLPGITLSGQVLELQYDDGTWCWTEKYDSVTSSTSSAHRKRLVGFDFDARLCQPVSPALVEKNRERIWAFEHADMVTLMDSLWHRCKGQSPEERLPVCNPTASFPYQSANHQNNLFHLEATETVKHTARPDKGTCSQCGEAITLGKSSKMRIHVGKHLLAQRISPANVNEDASTNPSSCGFCGGSSSCYSWLERKHGSATAFQVCSNCPYKEDFSYSAASRSSKTNPCTNRPTRCPMCPPDGRYIWSYELQHHLSTCHSATPLPSMIDQELKKFEPSCDEYTFMGVDRETGDIQVSKRGKRKRGPQASGSGTKSSSSKPKR
ncbi:hypothetical protein FRC09_012817 [Ceratobasidium sp. 395]|nr:hypothetical protein FRC09_012817 [Ceratobasidium sp. 395]